MDHREIEDKGILERYLQGRLGEEETTEFEAHLLECGDCFDAVRWGDDMGDALRAAAAQDVARTAVGAGILAWLARGRAAAWVLAVALVAAPSALYLREKARLQQVVAPQVNTPVFVLGAVRDGTPSRVSLGAAPEWMVLTMTLPSVEHPSYRAVLQNAAGEVIWRGDSLVPDAGDRLVVSFYSTFLEPGAHELRVTGPQGETPEEVFSFEVTQ